MRKINENNFVSYTISGSGWSLTIHKFADVLREWGKIDAGTLYGNKHDGTRAIIDTK